MDVKDYVTLALASVGAVLGVINTWKSLDRDRPKLRLTPAQAFVVGPRSTSEKFLCFDVTNLSSFPLTITEVGVLYRWTRKRGAIVLPIIRDGGEFPRKLEPRTSFSAYAAPGALANREHTVRCAYVKTACGLLVRGTSQAMKQLIREEALRR